MKRIFLSVFFLAAFVAKSDDTVTISKSRLQELEQKAAAAERLGAELSATKDEIARLKGEVQSKQVVIAKPLPKAVATEMEKLPPTK